MAQLLVIGNAGGGGGVVGPGNAIFVDPILGSDATGVRGNQALPFATFAAALLVAQNGDQVVLSPGQHSVPVTPMFPAVHTLTVRGAGLGVTVLVGGPGAYVISLSATTVDREFVLQDLTISSDTYGMYVDGAGAGRKYMPDAGTLGGLILSRVQFTGSAGQGFYIRYIRQFSFSEVSSSLTCVLETSGAQGYETQINGMTCVDLAVNWDDDDPDAPANPFFSFNPARGIVQLRNVKASGFLSMSSQPSVVADRACSVSILTATGGLFEALTGAVPFIRFSGRVENSIDFTGGAALPDSVNSGTYDFPDVQFAVAAFAGFERNGIVNGRSIVSLLGATWPTSGGQITAQDGVDVSASGSNSPTYSTFVSGTITPKHTTVAATAAVVGPNVVSWGWTAAASPTTVLVSGSAAGANPAVVGRTATGVTIDVAVNCNVDVRCEWGA